MADNVPITAGSGTNVATDEVAVNGGTTAHVQFLKQVDGRSNGTDGIPGDVNGLWTVNRKDALDIVVASAGLTTATTVYSAGDQVGTQFTFANAARASGGSGIITAAYLISAADITGPYDIVLSGASITLAADNAAYAISDADANKTITPINLAAALDIGNNRVAFAYNIAVPYTCVGGTSLFGGLITRVGHTFFGAVTDIQMVLTVERN